MLTHLPLALSATHEEYRGYAGECWLPQFRGKRTILAMATSTGARLQRKSCAHRRLGGSLSSFRRCYGIEYVAADQLIPSFDRLQMHLTDESASLSLIRC